MPTFLKLLKYIVILTVCCKITSCKDEDDNIITPPITQNVWEIAKSDPNLSVFVTALEKVGLVDTLQNEGTYTVLAPNNNAFDLLYNSLEVTGLEELDTTTLKAILNYHMIPNTKSSTSRLSSGDGAGYLTTMATGTTSKPVSLYYNATSGAKFNEIASIISGNENQKATNGILHEIDAVLHIPTVLELAEANPNLSNFFAAITRTDQAATLALLNDTANAPITIFAPQNTAFDTWLNTMDETGEISITTVDSALLSETLAYHTITLSNTTSALLNDGVITTLGGSITTTQTPATLTDANGTVATITTADIQATDGVLHIIDTVLLPMP